MLTKRGSVPVENKNKLLLNREVKRLKSGVAMFASAKKGTMA
jgi:hypothetical protein